LPVPTKTSTLPPAPETASPVAIEINPDVPALDVPEVRWMPPETPLRPALAVSNEKVPDVVGSEYPVVIEMSPPVAEAVVEPLTTTKSPPAPESPVPTST